jgi:hypothetical protein
MQLGFCQHMYANYHLLHDFSYREHLILYEPWRDAFFILLRQYIPDPISYSNIKQIQIYLSRSDTWTTHSACEAGYIFQ